MTPREIIAQIIDPVSFSMTPKHYGLERAEDFKRTMAYGAQLLAYQKADAILNAIRALGEKP